MGPSGGVSASSPSKELKRALHQNQRYQDHHPGLANRPGAEGGAGSSHHPHHQSMDIDSRLDQNLDDMASGLSRLKGLAMNLNDEMSDQNELIDRINIKTEDSHFNIGKQNKDMNKILGKK